MGDAIFLILVVNAVFFSLIFWLLTFLCKFFYQDKYSTYKLTFYECGFKSLTTVRISFSLHFFLIALFLVIYDSEFLFLAPFAFNAFYITSYQYFIFLFFMFWLILALVVDYAYAALDWTL